MVTVKRGLQGWVGDNPKPSPPMVSRDSGWERLERNKLAFKNYHKEWRRLTREQKDEILAEVRENAPLVPDKEDAEYLKSLNEWQLGYHQRRFELMIHSCMSKEHIAALTLASLTNPSLITHLYRQIEAVSVITGTLVFECLEAMNLYYGTEPFLEVWEKRGKRNESDKPSNSWDVEATQLFIEAGVVQAMEGKSIHEQGEMVAHLFYRNCKQLWQYEDNKAERELHGRVN